MIEAFQGTGRGVPIRRLALAACRFPTGDSRSTPPTSRRSARSSQGDWLTQGPAVKAFEEAVAEVCDVPHAVAFSSGTAALHGAAFAAGVGAGDELVTRR